jgi:hypothetical protein
LRDKRALEPLQAMMLSSEEPSFLQEAIGTINAPWYEGTAYVPPESLEVFQLAHDSETLAGEFYGPAEVEQLEEHLGEASPWVSSWCELALAYLDARAATPKLVQANLSITKFVALARLGTPEAVDHLIDALQSDDAETRRLALQGIQEAGRWAAPLLVELLDDQSLRVAGSGPVRTASYGDMEWPDEHWAKSALGICLANAGLPSKSVNLAAGQNAPPLDDEVIHIYDWWSDYGPDFLAGKEVPNPDVSIVFSMRN